MYVYILYMYLYIDISISIYVYVIIVYVHQLVKQKRSKESNPASPKESVSDTALDAVKFATFHVQFSTGISHMSMV